MAFTIEAIDGAVIFESDSSVQTLPNNQYRATFLQGSTTKIEILASDNQEANRILQILDSSDVTSITDNRTGGGGAIPVPPDLRDLYNTINPFFFRKLNGGGGGGVDPWLGLNGTKQPGAQNITSAFEYDSANGQEVVTDGNVHLYQNFHKQATVDYYTDPQDITSIVGSDELNDTLGIYPLNYKGQVRDATDGYNEQYNWVTNDNAFSYFAETNMLMDEGAAPSGSIGEYLRAVNTNGDFESFITHTGDLSTFWRIALDSLGSDVDMIMTMNEDERVSLLRREDNGVELLEQDFGFYGTSSSFGQRTSRFRHEAPGGLVNQMFIQDDLFSLRKDRTGGGRTEANVTSQGLDILNGDLTLNSISSDALGAGTINNYTNASLETSSTLRISGGAGVVNLTGIAAPSPVRNKILTIINGRGGNISLQNNDAGSLATNRFILSGNEILSPNEGAILQYDTGASRWRVVGIYQ